LPVTTLLAVNIPAHSHTGNAEFKLQADTAEASESSGKLSYPAQYPNAYSTTADVAMASPTIYSGVVANTGSNQSFPSRPPYLVLNYIICLEGIYPSRN
jgi:microcystin-dependent protein